MIHFEAIPIKVGRILRMHAAFIQGIGGPSRTEAEHHQPGFGKVVANPVLRKASISIPYSQT
jgi:hypothetical protein